MVQQSDAGHLALITVSVKSDISALRRQLDKTALKQLPFATSQAINKVLRAGMELERQSMIAAMPTATPFTRRYGLRVFSARKATPVGVLYIPPIQTRYLAPEILGEPQVLPRGSRAILGPIQIKTNVYGNIPRGALARLRSKKNIFIGAVDGVNGVWQRTPKPTRPGRRRKNIKAQATPGRSLKLLIRFADPKMVRTRWHFGRATQRLIREQYGRTLYQEVRNALGSSKVKHK